MVEMSVAEAMVELKLIVKKLETRTESIRKYSSKAKMIEDEIEDQEKYVKELIQSSEDLIKRYTRIKLAIQKSNIETTFEFQGKTYTIAEAILLKQGILDLHEKIWLSLTSITGRNQIDEYLRKFGMGTMSDEALEKLELVPHLFYDQKMKKDKLEELLELRSYLDRLIDKANHNKIINID